MAIIKIDDRGLQISTRNNFLNQHYSFLELCNNTSEIAHLAATDILFEAKGPLIDKTDHPTKVRYSLKTLPKMTNLAERQIDLESPMLIISEQMTDYSAINKPILSNAIKKFYQNLGEELSTYSRCASMQLSGIEELSTYSRCASMQLSGIKILVRLSFREIHFTNVHPDHQMSFCKNLNNIYFYTHAYFTGIDPNAFIHTINQNKFTKLVRLSVENINPQNIESILKIITKPNVKNLYISYQHSCSFDFINQIVDAMDEIRQTVNELHRSLETRSPEDHKAITLMAQTNFTTADIDFNYFTPACEKNLLKKILHENCQFKKLTQNHGVLGFLRFVHEYPHRAKEAMEYLTAITKKYPLSQQPQPQDLEQIDIHLPHQKITNDDNLKYAGEVEDKLDNPS